MPDLAVHYYFGQSVLADLPAEIHIEPAVFDFALSGPDDWFYCFTNNRLGRRAPYMHRNQTGAFLQSLASEPSLFPYFAGYCCHYMLDAACHPYIIACTGSYDHTRTTRQFRGRHVAFERTLDRWILKKHPGRHPLTDVMFSKPLPENLEAPLNHAYQNVFGWENVFPELLTAKRKMRRYLHILEDPSGKAKLITTIVPHPLLRPLPYSRQLYSVADVLNLSHRPWHHPKDPSLISSESFLELMEKARRDAVQTITVAFRGDFSLIGNRSYITGLDLDDPRNQAADTYPDLLPWK